MSKPTLVQSLLNLPSQTYGNADTRPKEYYSTRQEMLRIAASAQAERGESPGGSDRSDGGAIVKNVANSMTKRTEPMNSSTLQAAIKLAQTQQRSRPLSEDDSDDSDLEVFFTPNTSPRTSMASSVATITFPSSRKPSRRSLTNVKADSHQPLQLPPTEPPGSKPSTSTTTSFIAVPSTRTPSTSSSQATRARHALSSSSSLSSTSLDGHSVFSDYFGSGESTLLTTPYQSDSGEGGAQPKGKSKAAKVDTVRSTTTDAKWRNQHYTNEDWAKDVRWLVPPPNSSGSSTPASGTKPRTSASPASTSSANSGKASADKSIGSVSGSAKKSIDSKSHNHGQPKVGSNLEGTATSTGTGSSTKGKEKENAREKEKKPTCLGASQSTNISPSTTARSSKKYVPPKQPHTFSAFASIPVSEPSATTSSPKTSHTLPNGHATSKTPPNTNSSAPKPSSATLRAEAASAPSLLPPNNDSFIPTYKYSSGPSQNKKPPNNHHANPNPSTSTQRRKPSAPKPPPSTMVGMDALLEEDEDGPLTPRMESKAIEGQEGGWDWGSDWDAGHKGRKAAALGAGQEANDGRQSSGSQGSQGTAQSRSLRHTTPTDLRRRRSRSLDSFSSTSTTTARRSPAQPQTLTAEVQALVQGFVSPGERSSRGAQGYTSLVLPRAPPPALSSITGSRPGKTKGDGWLSTNGKIDLTKTGVAQTTMATVEVVRGLGSKGGSGILGLVGFGRRRASSGPRHGHGPAPLPLAPPSGAGARSNTSGENGQAPVPVPGVQGTPLGFTSYRTPPNYVPSESVLVQVWAVGVDGVDGKLVGIKFGGNGEIGRAEEDEVAQTDQEAEEERAEETELEEDDEERRRDEEGAGNSTETTPTKKGGLAALGRSLSLRLSRAGSSKQKTKQGDLQRSASAAATSANGWSKTKQDQEKMQHTPPEPPNTHKRSLSFSLKRSNTAVSHTSTLASVASSSPNGKDGKRKKNGKAKETQADVGYIPGRSFVGRVLECGWDVRDEVVRKGEWVVGLLDVRKAGALAEFIVVDRHRVRRVPQPREGSVSNDPHAPTSPVWAASPTSPGSSATRSLTLDELALLPLCGLPAYRAVRTFMFAFSSIRDGNSPPSGADRRGIDFGNVNSNRTMADHDHGYRRRVLVLRGHDGAGAMAVQMLVRRGWRVSVHVPFSSVPAQATQELADQFMHVVEERAREWGADEVIFDDGEEGGGPDDGRGAAVRVLDTLREDGDVFDAVLDTIGGKEIREAGERLLGSHGSPLSAQEGTSSPVKSPTVSKRRGVGQFTTLVGDVPERTIPSAGDNFRAGLRSLRLGSNDSAGNGAGNKAHEESSGDVKGHGKIGYAWVSVAQDVDWEGDDVGETLGTVVRLALEDGVRPPAENVDTSGNGHTGILRSVPFEQAPSVFMDNGPLRDGGTVVVKVAA